MGFLTWMVVVQTYPHMPRGVDSWQRLGIGCFMIVIIIKRLTMALLYHQGKKETNKVLEGVDIHAVHNSTGFPVLQIMWIQANQSLK